MPGQEFERTTSPYLDQSGSPGVRAPREMPSAESGLEVRERAQATLARALTRKWSLMRRRTGVVSRR